MKRWKKWLIGGLSGGAIIGFIVSIVRSFLPRGSDRRGVGERIDNQLGDARANNSRARDGNRELREHNTRLTERADVAAESVDKLRATNRRARDVAARNTAIASELRRRYRERDKKDKD